MDDRPIETSLDVWERRRVRRNRITFALCLALGLGLGILLVRVIRHL